jgi:hypothetical protein
MGRQHTIDAGFAAGLVLAIPLAHAAPCSLADLHWMAGIRRDDSASRCAQR